MVKHFPPDEAEVIQYYQAIAPDYDRSRFHNTYGSYIDARERQLLTAWLAPYRGKSVLDLACGTGRFLNFATVGLDASDRMVQLARSQYPDLTLMVASASQIPLESHSFDAVFSLHFFMHLTPAKLASVIAECYRILRPHGTLIFDIPSSFRRRIVSYQSHPWHGATSFSLGNIQALCHEGKWHWEQLAGVALFPIHRIPPSARLFCRPVDSLLCDTGLKFLASYYLIQLIKRDG
ncbi:class I SAM-dependent methyltransferase [Phormidium sp. CCY1219]|uniref:class I SAM-dependent methyltransferase n=1 Tax=Phormidium sp. CCY1219 TaxID=2886104 RepID=UPI002D1EC1DB|nr:class I SAM-dependent methyltransferase [Phormidium sp. CCY1219]MEB3829184.1 class I SAM-dependent methyltransferase [Phormidium sp. CCY1219]